MNRERPLLYFNAVQAYNPIMDEATTPANELDGRSLYELTPSERTVEQNIQLQIDERRSQVELLKDDRNSVSESIDFHYGDDGPAIKQRLIGNLEAEITALQALDPATATGDEVHNICSLYKQERDSLANQ